MPARAASLPLLRRPFPALAAVLLLAGTHAGRQLVDGYPLGPTSLGPAQLVPIDVDGDGDADVLASAVYDERLSWFENEGGAFAGQHAIAKDVPNPYGIHAADLDGDGDPDLQGTLQLANALDLALGSF